MKIDQEAMKELVGHPITALLNFVGGISGAIALATVIFYGGALIEKIHGLDARVAKIEGAGSDIVREHIKEDQAETKATLQRLAVVEEAVKKMSQIEGDVREIKTTLQWIRNLPSAAEPKKANSP